MACRAEDFESTPSYTDLINRVIEFVIHEFRRDPTPEDDFSVLLNFEATDIALFLLAGVVLIILRYCATKWIFKPLGEIYGLTEANKRKMPESAWRFTYCFLAWMYLYYVLILSGKYCFFQKPSTLWDGWTFSLRPHSDIYSVYVLYAGIYGHALYGTLFLDNKRQDTAVMLAHHILTLFLIFSSHCLRYHNVGIVVLFLHEVCEFLVEFTKVNIYFKTQHGALVKMHERLVHAGFWLSLVTWFVLRLYWFPLKVLYATHSAAGQKTCHCVWGITTNIMLWLLQSMNVYWFALAIWFVVRFASGDVSELDDTREFDVEEKFSKKQQSTSDTVCETNDSGDKKSVLEKSMNSVTNGNGVLMEGHARKRQK